MHPVHSTSIDDFAKFLDAELDSANDTSSDEEDDISSPQQTLKVSTKKDICEHPGAVKGMCMLCGQDTVDASGVPFGYIYKDFRLSNSEISRLRSRDLQNLSRQKKLYLILDLDHTLLNSTELKNVSSEEEYLLQQTDSLQDISKGNLFRLDFMGTLTKLRPFVRTFLKEASKLFEMYIYTNGDRAYALEMAKLLDPGDVYFYSRVISRDDSTKKHQKGLDVVLAQESAVLILDDAKLVWVEHNHTENLLLMEQYHFFASSCKQFGLSRKSLSQLRSDESEANGALATVLKVLKQIHSMFFDPELGDNFANRDVRQVLKTVRKEILKGCKFVFSRDSCHSWKMAEQMGATCLTEFDPLVTHVISTDARTEESRWAVQEKKFLVHPRWIEAAYYLWKKQPEENFPVKQMDSSEVTGAHGASADKQRINA